MPQSAPALEDAREITCVMIVGEDQTVAVGFDEDLVFVDYDDARDPETGAVHPVVHEHVQTAGSYADVSPTGTGVHILCQGQFPDDVTTIADDLPVHDAFPEASIEVYDSARFVAMSGQHLVGTPTETQAAQAFIDGLVEAFTTPQPNSPEPPQEEPPLPHRRSPPSSTTDIEDVYRAIETTRPSEIRLDSPVTETRSDGTKSRNPCWTSSDSGTRLAEMDDGWIYRDGLVVLDALQVVALEEGIVTTAGDYPSGRDFWRAVDDLNIETDGVPTAFWLHDSTTTTAERLTEWFAAGEVSDQLLQSLPSPPGQTPGEGPETAESAATQITDESDPAQAGLDMF